MRPNITPKEVVFRGVKVVAFHSLLYEFNPKSNKLLSLKIGSSLLNVAGPILSLFLPL